MAYYPFRFVYNQTILEPGFYVVKVDAEAATIAQYDGQDHWEQLGIDYDVWQYNGNYAASKIMIHDRIVLKKES